MQQLPARWAVPAHASIRLLAAWPALGQSCQPGASQPLLLAPALPVLLPLRPPCVLVHGLLPAAAHHQVLSIKEALQDAGVRHLRAPGVERGRAMTVQAAASTQHAKPMLSVQRPPPSAPNIHNPGQVHTHRCNRCRTIMQKVRRRVTPHCCTSCMPPVLLLSSSTQLCDTHLAGLGAAEPAVPF